MLRHEVSPVYDLDVDVIAQLLREGAMYDLEGSPLVVRLEVLHILQQESAGSFLRNNPNDIEEQGTLSLVIESMLVPEGVLLGHASNREWLTRKPGEKDIVIRNLLLFDLCDVPGYLMTGGKINRVALLSVLVP